MEHRARKPRAWSWDAAIRTLRKNFKAIDQGGGFEPIVADWEKTRPDLIDRYVHDMAAMIERCNAYLPILEKARKR